MNKQSALAIYIVVIIIVFILALYFQIRIWSSLVLALFIGLIILFFLTPQASIDNYKRRSCGVDWIYLAIWAITLLIIIFYLIDRIFRDRSVEANDCIFFCSV